MPLTQQAKLLRVLQTGELHPVGSSKVRRVSVRVVAATNVDLGKAVAEGRFREDLLYRLNTVEMQLPPLRERREDIPLLAAHFLGRARPDATASRHEASRRRPWRRCWPTPGRATCASWSTRSSARCSWPAGTR